MTDADVIIERILTSYDTITVVGASTAPAKAAHSVPAHMQLSPTTRLHDSWLASRDEWERGVHQDGAGLHADEDVDTDEGFAAWAGRLHRAADTSIPAGEGGVHATCRWIVEDDTYLGAISLRHALNDFLLRAGGNIGYGIRPSARRRGLAAWALRSVLPAATSRMCAIPNSAGLAATG